MRASWSSNSAFLASRTAVTSFIRSLSQGGERRDAAPTHDPLAPAPERPQRGVNPFGISPWAACANPAEPGLDFCALRANAIRASKTEPWILNATANPMIDVTAVPQVSTTCRPERTR